MCVWVCLNTFILCLDDENVWGVIRSNNYNPMCMNVFFVIADRIRFSKFVALLHLGQAEAWRGWCVTQHHVHECGYWCDQERTERMVAYCRLVQGRVGVLLCLMMHNCFFFVAYLSKRSNQAKSVSGQFDTRVLDHVTRLRGGVPMYVYRLDRGTGHTTSFT